MRKRIVAWLIDSGSIDEEEREIYEYAIQSLKLLIIPAFYAVFMGWLLQEWGITLCFVFVFASVRKFSGGYHAKTEVKCTLFSLLSIFLGVESVKIIDIGLGLKIAFLVSVLIILMASPVASPNKRLEKNDKKSIRKIIFIIEAAICAMIIFLYGCQHDTYNYIKSIAIANIFVALFQIVPIITNKIQKRLIYS